MRAGLRTLPFGVKLPWFRLQPGWSQSTVLHALVKFQQLLNNPPVSSACHKAGRNPRTGASGLAQRWYIDPYYVFSWWSWFTFGVWVWCVCAAKTECVSVCVSPFSRPYLARVWPVTSSQVPEELMFPSGLVGPSSFLNTPTESSLDHNFSHTHTHRKTQKEEEKKVKHSLLCRL